MVSLELGLRSSAPKGTFSWQKWSTKRDLDRDADSCVMCHKISDGNGWLFQALTLPTYWTEQPWLSKKLKHVSVSVYFNRTIDTRGVNHTHTAERYSPSPSCTCKYQMASAGGSTREKREHWHPPFCRQRKQHRGKIVAYVDRPWH